MKLERNHAWTLRLSQAELNILLKLIDDRELSQNEEDILRQLGAHIRNVTDGKV